MRQRQRQPNPIQSTLTRKAHRLNLAHAQLRQ